MKTYRNMVKYVPSRLFSSTLLFAACLTSSLIPGSAMAQDVTVALSHRHEVPAVADLEKLAGGRDALITQLLELRTSETPPFLGLRAEKLLLNFADDERVADALTSDIEVEGRAGLARLLVMNVDKVSSDSVRQRIAGAALERAARDESFAKHARFLLQSSDAEVSRMAREKLE